MGKVCVEGALTGMQESGAPTAASFSAPLSLLSGQKMTTSASGILRRMISVAAPGYVELSAVGDGRDVPKADTLYLKLSGDMLLRVTQENGADPPTEAVIPVRGLFVMEAHAQRLITKVELQGSGSVEYFASGP